MNTLLDGRIRGNFDARYCTAPSSIITIRLIHDFCSCVLVLFIIIHAAAKLKSAAPQNVSYYENNYYNFLCKKINHCFYSKTQVKWICFNYLNVVLFKKKKKKLANMNKFLCCRIRWSNFRKLSINRPFFQRLNMSGY